LQVLGNKEISLIVELKRYSDFATKPIGLDGSKLKIEEILNLEIVVTGYRILTSKYPDKNKSGLTLQLQFKIFKSDTDLDKIPVNILFTGSDVLIDQIKSSSDSMPFLTKIVKINRYLSCS